MGHLSIKINDCNYQEDERKLKEQPIKGINSKVMTSEMIKELTSIRNSSEVTNVQLLAWVKIVWAQELHKAMLATIQENNEFDMMQCTTNNNCEQGVRLYKQKNHEDYEIMSQKPRQCPAYSNVYPCYRSQPLSTSLQNPGQSQEQNMQEE